MKIAIAVLLSFLSSICFGQANIHGTLKDEASNPIGGASVHLLNTAYSTRTDSKGEFVFNNLNAGSYTIHVFTESYGETYKTIALQSGKNIIEIIHPKRSNTL